MPEKIRVFVSVPMANRSDEEIEQAIYEETQIFLSKGWEKQQIIFVDNFHGYKEHQFYENTKNKSLSYIGEAFKKISTCDLVVFGKGWKKARGCMIEATACTLYNVAIVDQDE